MMCIIGVSDYYLLIGCGGWNSLYAVKLYSIIDRHVLVNLVEISVVPGKHTFFFLF